MAGRSEAPFAANQPPCKPGRLMRAWELMLPMMIMPSSGNACKRKCKTRWAFCPFVPVNVQNLLRGPEVVARLKGVWLPRA